ncbi:MAG: hypothetical protein MSC30_05255 [Gaiellaceae bacterium MAG52_C11]|nr:hypothetical protein [Candidatus Gaiellasilicea maunaloa]
MRRPQTYAVVTAGVLLALLGLAVALRGGDDDGPTATTDATTTSETSGTTEPGETGATTATRTETQGEAGTGTGTGSDTGTGTGTGIGTGTGTGTAATGTTTDPEPERPYALEPTRSCLNAAGAAVSPVRSTDPRLRALGDLAQRTSLEVRLDGRTLGLAFGDARLLESLLVVPDDPYRLEVRRNALLMYRPDARDAAAVLRGCLRS